MGMNITLTPPLESMVQGKVASGLYSSPSEVMRDALRLMQEQDDMNALRLEKLRGNIAQGLNSGPGELWDVGAVKRSLHARHSAKSSAKARA